MSAELPPIDWSGPWVPYRPSGLLANYGTDGTSGDYAADHGHEDAFYGSSYSAPHAVAVSCEGVPGFDASTGKDWTDRYGWCEWCKIHFTYHGLWHGACGDCVWRWTHYPDTMPPHLRRYRADMPHVRIELS